jgi:hypothetical protein
MRPSNQANGGKAMTIYQTSLNKKADVIKSKADYITKIAAEKFHRTGEIDARTVRKISELNYKSALLSGAARRACG